MPDALHPEPTSEQVAALDVLCSSRRILLTGHERPDGDCIGAQAALSRILSQLGHEVTILNPDPPEAQYDYLSRACSYGVDQGEPLPENDLVVLLDCSELSRTGSLAERFAASPSRKMVLDHHVLPAEPWWDVAFHDVHASSTGLLVYRIARYLSVELDTVAAEGVFTSMVTDTGWFKYSNTDAETLAAAADLVLAGVQPAQMFGAIYQRRDATHPQAVAGVLGRTAYYAGGRLAVVDLPLDEAGRAVDLDTEDVLDLLRSVSDVEVVLLVREIEHGLCKLSARSKSGYDVNALARRFGGGGHTKASGATIPGSLGDVRTILIDAAVEGFDAS